MCSFTRSELMLIRSCPILWPSCSKAHISCAWVPMLRRTIKKITLSAGKGCAIITATIWLRLERKNRRVFCCNLNYMMFYFVNCAFNFIIEFRLRPETQNEFKGDSAVKEIMRTALNFSPGFASFFASRAANPSSRFRFAWSVKGFPSYQPQKLQIWRCRIARWQCEQARTCATTNGN